MMRELGIRPAVLGLYTVKDGKLRRAQMFYFDPVAVASYIARANVAAMKLSLRQ